MDFLWWQVIDYFSADRAPTTEAATGIESYTCTRPLLESTIRQRVSQLPNVAFLT